MEHDTAVMEHDTAVLLSLFFAPQEEEDVECAVPPLSFRHDTSCKGFIPWNVLNRFVNLSSVTTPRNSIAGLKGAKHAVVTYIISAF